MIKWARRFLRDEQGLESMEYAVMLALIIAALVVALVGLAGAITARYGGVEGLISGD